MKSSNSPRIITGTFKGFKLKVPTSARPVTDRVKTYIFDALGDIQDVIVVDLFAGSGNLGIEALSRGASQVTFVESDTDAIRKIRENITDAGIEDSRVRILLQTIQKYLHTNPQTADLIFADPPFELIGKLQIKTLMTLMHENSILILKIDDTKIAIPSELQILQDKVMGKNRVIILKKL